jgi:acyl carrier protein
VSDIRDIERFLDFAERTYRDREPSRHGLAPRLRCLSAWPASRGRSDQNERLRQGVTAMTDLEILAGLGEIVEEIVGVPANEVTPGKSFAEDLDIDSLSMVEIAVAAQDKFGVEIPDDQLKDLTMVQDVVTYVSKYAGSSR